MIIKKLKKKLTINLLQFMAQQNTIMISLSKKFDMDYHLNHNISIWDANYSVLEWNHSGDVRYTLIGLPTYIFTKEQIISLIRSEAFSYLNYMKYAQRKAEYLVSCGSYPSVKEAIKEVHAVSFYNLSRFYTTFGREVVKATSWFSKLIDLDVDEKSFPGFGGLKQYCYYQLMRAIEYGDNQQVEQFYNQFNM